MGRPQAPSWRVLRRSETLRLGVADQSRPMISSRFALNSASVMSPCSRMRPRPCGGNQPAQRGGCDLPRPAGPGSGDAERGVQQQRPELVIGLLLPGTLLGLVAPSGDATFVAESFLALTAGAVALALRGRGLDRRAGSFIIVCYIVFAGVVATR